MRVLSVGGVFAEKEALTVLELPVTGMTCAGCAARVQKRLAAQPGVSAANVNLALDTAEITTNMGGEAFPDLVDAVRDLGFGIAEERLELEVSGMRCAACAATIQKALKNVDGVLDATANPALDTATVRYVRGSLDAGQLIDAIKASGYGATLASEQTLDTDEQQKSDQRERLELLIATLLTLPLVGQMVSMVTGLGWHLPVWIEVALATPVQFWIGRRFYRAAWRALKSRSGNMDQLVVLGTSAAYFYSLWLVLSQGTTAAGQLYFEAAAVIMTLILTGKYLESRAKRSASSAIRELMALQPERARVLRGGNETEIAIAEVALGEVVIVKPGERLPVDGLVIKGESELDESLLTGESMPILRKTGDPVVAGAVNGNGLLRLRATRIGKDTTLAAIGRLVSQAQGGKAPIQRLVDRISAIFVPIVLVIVAMTFAAWLLLGQSMDVALIAAISVAVIACPCALGLATPTALVAGTGAAARHGILIKNIETLERAHNIDTVVFDKTGTLTEGKPELVSLMAQNGNDDELLTIAASAQMGSEHPLAAGIVNAAKAKGLKTWPLDRFTAYVGQGIEAVLDGQTLRIGRMDFALGPPDPTWISHAQRLEDQGQTVAWVARDGTFLGLIGLADQIRSDSRDAVAKLKSKGITVHLLTGDNQTTATRIAQDLGIDHVMASARPEDKAAYIADLHQSGRNVAMVGDGVNDAPALAAASVGIAMGGGAAVAGEASGITLMRPNPALILDAMAIAAKTSSKIRQNLFWAFIYNLIGLPIAAMGLLSPAVAGAAMAFSSVSVVTNSLLLKRWTSNGAHKS